MKVYRNAILLSASSYLGAVFNLAATALFARSLDVDGFGALNAALVAAALAFQVGDLGVATIFTKRVAQDHQAGARDFGYVFSLRLVIGLTVLLAMLTVSTLVPAMRGARLLVPLIGLAVLFEFMSEVPLAVVRGQQRMAQQAQAGVVESTLVLAGSALLWLGAARHMQPGVASVGFVFVAAAIARCCFSLWAARQPPALILDQGARSHWSGLLSESAPVGITNLISQLMLRMSVLLIVFFRGDREAGVYSASYVIFSGMQILWTAFLISLFPHASAEHARDTRAIWLTWRRAALQIVAMTVATGLGVLLLREPIVRLLFGAGYLETLRVLPLLLCANALLALTSLCGTVLTVIGEARVIPRAQVGALVLNVILDVVLIQRLGFIGAGLGMIAGQTALLLIMLALMARARSGALQVSMIDATR